MNGGSSLIADPPKLLFALSPSDLYAASPDGLRFLVNRIVADAPSISIIVNWKPSQQSK